VNNASALGPVPLPLLLDTPVDHWLIDDEALDALAKLPRNALLTRQFRALKKKLVLEAPSMAEQKHQLNPWSAKVAALLK
jgi:hypothetical protein